MAPDAGAAEVIEPARTPQDVRWRSNPQLRYLKGVVYKDLLAGVQRIAAEAEDEPVWHSVLDAEEAMKFKFLGDPYAPTPTSMRILSAFTDECVLWGLERGISVTRPGYPSEEEP